MTNEQCTWVPIRRSMFLMLDYIASHRGLAIADYLHDALQSVVQPDFDAAQTPARRLSCDDPTDVLVRAYRGEEYNPESY